MMIIDQELISGRFDPNLRDGFIEFEGELGNGTMFLQLDAYTSFIRMKEAASTVGLSLIIVSAFRGFEKQKELWESKWTGATPLEGLEFLDQHADPLAKARKIMEYTAPPGFSRHHWGTEIDINSVEPDFFDTEFGQRTYQWLQYNAPYFGYCQTYNAFNPDRPFGFQEEKWHWSYKPLSYPIWSAQMKQFDHQQMHPFIGVEAVQKIGLLDYVRNVNHCPEIE